LTDHREICHGDAYCHIDACLQSSMVHGRRINNNKKSRYVDKALTDQDDLTVTHLNPD